MADTGLVIAIAGAESTGKTVLAERLAERIAQDTGVAVTWVPEHLRDWCDRAGRTPQPHEQAAIAEAQQRAIEHAAAHHAVVVADTVPLMTAVYSRLLFADDSLAGPAMTWHRRCAITLVTALDLPWEADGHQRDGPHVQGPVDSAVRDLLIAHRLPWAVVGGTGPSRLENAVDAVAPLLRQLPATRQGLFTRLQARNEAEPQWTWTCDCDDPECERRSLGSARQT